jgi:hypothetical protein
MELFLKMKPRECIFTDVQPMYNLITKHARLLKVNIKKVITKQKARPLLFAFYFKFYTPCLSPSCFGAMPGQIFF